MKLKMVRVIGFLSIAAAGQVFAQTGTWATKAFIPNAVYAPAAGAIGGKLYVVGGALSCTDSDALEVYDPATDIWTSKTPLPEPRHFAGAGVIDGKLYVVGGASSCFDGAQATLYMYDPGTNTWTRKADMSTPRRGHAVAVIAGKLYALGGVIDTSNTRVNTFEMYDPGTNAWTTKASFPTQIETATAGVVNGKLYVAGGFDGVCCTSLATLRVYDSATDAWTSKASLPSGRNQAAGGVINGILYVAGGIDGADNTDTLFAYDPATDLWTTKASMSAARGGHAAATINGQLYVVGGNGAGGVGLLSSLEVYTPVVVNIVVTSTANSGAGSLRATIAAANVDGVVTVITFDPAVFPPPPSPPGTIFLTSRLPALTGTGDSIDGSEAGVVIDGSALADDSSDIGIRLRAGNITIRFLTIQNFPATGVSVQPAGGASGVAMTGVVINSNVIQSNLNGIVVSGQEGPGNEIGVSINNNTLIQNGNDGIVVNASSVNPGVGTSGNTVDVVIDNNVIRGSEGVSTGGTRTGDGIRVTGGGGSDNTLTATISNNNIWDNIDDGIIVRGSGAAGVAHNVLNVEILNNNVRGRGTKTTATEGNGIKVAGGNRIGSGVVSTGNDITFVIENNNVQKFKDTGIHIAGGLGSFHAVNGSVASNDVNDIIGADVGLGTGILIHSGECNSSCNNNTLSDIVIEDNKVSGSSLDGIAVFLGQGFGQTVSLLRITGNVTNRNGLDGLLVGAGVLGSGATPVSGNRADRNGVDGIDLNSTGYVVSNNTASKNAVDGINAIGNINGGGNTAKNNASCNTPGCF